MLLCEGAISRRTIAALRQAFAIGPSGAGARSFALDKGIADLIGPRGEMGDLALRHAGHPVRPVRVLIFDKSQESNWAVPWHQDRTIAVRQRIEVVGFGPWSVKDGVVHVEPPVSILQAMLTLRLFVDDCAVDNGPLEVAVGSHQYGRVAASDVADVVARSAILLGTGRAGDVIVVKTLAIHRSARARSPSHRRVLHVDYAGADLPAPLEWHIEAIA